MQVVTPEFTDIALWIGRSSGLGEAYFKGLISRVRVYNRALSEQEIFAQFASCARDYYKDLVHPKRVMLDVQ